MYTPDMSKSEFYEHCVPSIMSSKITSNSNYLAPSYSEHADSGHQTPLNIYNNYNPNFHHHHYYYPNFQDYGYQSSVDHNWVRKYDCENQKEYFIANSPPTPSDYCDFEVPQQQHQIDSTLKSASKFINDVDKFFFENPISAYKSHNKDQMNNNNIPNSCDNYSFWESEKNSKKCLKNDEKFNKNELLKKDDKNCGIKITKDSDRGEKEVPL